MTFREQAAIALFGRGVQLFDEKHNGDRWVTTVSRMVEPSDVIKHAQALADACCAAWGHDRVLLAPGNPYTCRRCGAKEKR